MNLLIQGNAKRPSTLSSTNDHPQDFDSPRIKGHNKTNAANS